VPRLRESASACNAAAPSGCMKCSALWSQSHGADRLVSGHPPPTRLQRLRRRLIHDCRQPLDQFPYRSDRQRRVDTDDQPQSPPPREALPLGGRPSARCHRSNTSTTTTVSGLRRQGPRRLRHPHRARPRPADRRAAPNSHSARSRSSRPASTTGDKQPIEARPRSARPDSTAPARQARLHLRHVHRHDRGLETRWQRQATERLVHRPARKIGVRPPSVALRSEALDGERRVGVRGSAVRVERARSDVLAMYAGDSALTGIAGRARASLIVWKCRQPYSAAASPVRWPP
jgi:hypothetical protein